MRRTEQILPPRLFGKGMNKRKVFWERKRRKFVRGGKCVRNGLGDKRKTGNIHSRNRVYEYMKRKRKKGCKKRGLRPQNQLTSRAENATIYELSACYGEVCLLRYAFPQEDEQFSINMASITASMKEGTQRGRPEKFRQQSSRNESSHACAEIRNRHAGLCGSRH